jgi:tripartite-type tricarboxylate transporter receptor subunit TctC
MRSLISGLFMLLCAPVFAQQQTPPIINFESVPNPLQLPQNMYFGEVRPLSTSSRQGKLRALAVTAPKRIPVLRDVPTVVEEGYPNLVMEDWIGLVVKSGSPNEAVERLNTAVNRVLGKQAIQSAFARLGYEPAGGTAGELGDLIRSQVAYWGSVVKESGIKMPQ